MQALHFHCSYWKFYNVHICSRSLFCRNDSICIILIVHSCIYIIHALSMNLCVCGVVGDGEGTGLCGEWGSVVNGAV